MVAFLFLLSYNNISPVHCKHRTCYIRYIKMFHSCQTTFIKNNRCVLYECNLKNA